MAQNKDILWSVHTSSATKPSPSLGLVWTPPRLFLLLQKQHSGVRLLTPAKQLAGLPPTKKYPCGYSFLWAVQESNLWPFLRQRNALPTELTARSIFKNQPLKFTRFLPFRQTAGYLVMLDASWQTIDQNQILNTSRIRKLYICL